VAVKYGISIVLALVVALSAAIPAALAAQPGQDQTTKSKVEDLINTVSSILENLRKLGINVSKAESLLNDARNALSRGDIGKARELAVQALVEAGSRAREVRPPAPVAAGVAMELGALKSVVQSLSDEGLKQRLLANLTKAEEALSRGSVNETVKIVKEVREELRKQQEKAREAVVERARVEVEARVRTRTQEELGNLIAENLRNARGLADIGKALSALRVTERIREKFNATMESLDENLTELGHYAAQYLRSELGEGLAELEQYLSHVPPGLKVSINTTIKFIDKLMDRLPAGLKDEAENLKKALTDLRDNLDKVYRCETDLGSIRSEIAEVVSNVGKYISPPRGQPKSEPKNFTAVVQLYATAKWALTLVDTLPKIISCPSPGSSVEFRGVVLKVREDKLVIAYGTLMTYSWAGKEQPTMQTPLGPFKLRPAVKVGVFALNLSQVGSVNVSAGNIVVCLGKYQGYSEQVKMPVILVSKIWITQLEEILKD